MKKVKAISLNSGRYAAIALALIAAVSFSTRGIAGTSSSNFNVTASVGDECSISANDLAFGTYSVISGAAVENSTTIAVTCTSTTSYDVGLGSGDGSGATVTTRKLTKQGASDTLNYSLYQNANHTTVWGETVDTDTVAGSGSGVSQSLTVYGQISASQNVPVGSYNDVISVTLTY